MSVVVPITEMESEAARVERWRLQTLIDAGYPVPLADRLAARPEVDLHQAVELVKRDCPPEIAARILL